MGGNATPSLRARSARSEGCSSKLYEVAGERDAAGWGLAYEGSSFAIISAMYVSYICAFWNSERCLQPEGGMPW